MLRCPFTAPVGSREGEMSLSITSAFKSRVKRTLLGPEAIPQFVTINLPAGPQQQIKIHLTGLGEPRDVTQDCTTASLRPLMLAIGLRDETEAARLSRKHPELALSESADPSRVLGRIGLRLVRTIPLPKGITGLFETIGHANYCLPTLQLRRHYLYRQWQSRNNRDPRNFRMSPADLRNLNVFYICPRPVVLVSVVCGERSNIFPMDLIGPLGNSHFAMALRSTSPAIALMQESRQLALSSMTLEHEQTVYNLGKHHKLERIDWSSLPFKTMPSAGFGLPVPEAARRVAERHVVDTHTVGSHTLFITTLAQETCYGDGGQMAHIAGFYNDYLRRKARTT